MNDTSPVSFVPEMITQEEIVQAIRELYAAPLIRAPDSYGCSGVGFCDEKMVLEKRLNDPNATNGDMVVGKIMHKELPLIAGKIIKNRLSKKYPPRVVSFQVDDNADKLVNSALAEQVAYQKDRADFYIHQYEVTKALSEAKYEIETDFQPEGQPFKLRGHIDIDLPGLDLCIEFKTTGRTDPMDSSDFILKAYEMQGNAYAVIRGRKFFQMWIYHKQFVDLSKEVPMDTIDCQADPELFKKFIERVRWIDDAVKKGKDLAGPEQRWECKHCSFLFKCPHHIVSINNIMAKIPCEKKEIPPELEWDFDLLTDRSLLVYNRSSKKWVKPEVKAP